MNVDKVRITGQGQHREIRARAQADDREITLKWPMDTADRELDRLIDHLTLHIEEVTFARTSDGYEIQAHMTVANRSFLSTWVVSPDDGELRAAFESMLSRVDRQAVCEMEGFMARVTSDESEPVAPSQIESDSPVQPLRRGA